MMEQRVFEYLVNSLWQLPLLVMATWLVVRITRPRLLVQHTLWLAALLLGVLLPLRGIDWNNATTTMSPAAMDSTLLASELIPAASFPALPPRQPNPLRTIAALRVHPLLLEPRLMQWLIDLYAVSVAYSLVRLAHGWIAARKLVAAATQHPLSTLESTLLRACAERLELAPERIPTIRYMDDHAASPMVIGMHCPVLLLPESLRHTNDAAFDDNALTAVLLHELAHVRRRDFLSNLLARVVALPIAYHPATQALHTRIRQTREFPRRRIRWLQAADGFCF